MPSKRVLLAAVFVLSLAAIPHLAFAQYGGTGTGSALSNNPMMHQGFVQPGISDLQSRAQHESPATVLKEVTTGLKDADPNVRVEQLKKLRSLQDPEANKLLIRSLSDPDIRVRIKAVDLLGTRGANEAVGPMSQMLFLRSTEPIVKLHVVAALGRIGDARGALPVMQYLDEERREGDNPQACGTAVFALGEIGNENASPLLTKVIASDKSEMVRRLAKEALEKIDGELPTRRSARLAQEENKKFIPTDERLAKMREFDKKVQQMER